MKREMAMFVAESALKGTKFAYDTGVLQFGFFNPYQQFPSAPRKLAYMDRPLFEGHKTYPHLSRPARASMALLSINAAAPVIAAAGTSVLAATAVHESYSSFEPENVNEKTSFWQGFAAALSGGFSMGGGIQIN